MATSSRFSSVHSDLLKMARLAASQLRAAIECFRTRDLAAADRIIEQDDVVDNLNIAVEERCFALAATGSLSAEELRTARAILKVSLNFERIGDAATHIAKRVRIMDREQCPPAEFDIGEAVDIAVRAVDVARDAFLGADLARAQQACLQEPAFDRVFVRQLRVLQRRMEAEPPAIPFLFQCLSVLKYLEKVADYVLNIGEQTMFLVTGRRLKFSQFQQLDRLLGAPTPDASDFQTYSEGISGAVVARVVGPLGPAVFKEGYHRKIEAEQEKLQAWQRIRAGLTPRVLGSVSLADRRALLTEYVEGTLLSELYRSPAAIEDKIEATRQLLSIVVAVWESTFSTAVPTVDYVEQIEARLPDVFALHPPLSGVADAVAGDPRGMAGLLDRLRPLQAAWAPPFSVWLHGDFNANNVVHCGGDDPIRFIDVHRSRYGDYLQDIGVFLLSVDRHPDLSERARAHVMRVNDYVRDTAGAFGIAHGDRACEPRLHLSLARSCITSGRVIVDEAMAASLLRRGIALLKGLVTPR